LIAERHAAVFDKGEDFLGAVTVIHDVPDIVHANAVAEAGGERIADEFERLRK